MAFVVKNDENNALVLMNMTPCEWLLIIIPIHFFTFSITYSYFKIYLFLKNFVYLRYCLMCIWFGPDWKGRKHLPNIQNYFQPPYPNPWTMRMPGCQWLNRSLRNVRQRNFQFIPYLLAESPLPGRKLPLKLELPELVFSQSLVHNIPWG